MGTSKGAEAALLIGTRHPELRALIAAAPSSGVWPGINWESLNTDSSWTSKGEPLPHVPYASFHPAILLGDAGRVYKDAVTRVDNHPDAAIPIEEIRGAILLACGELDRLWPACPMSRQLQQRAENAGTAQVEVLAHAKVGHADLFPPYSHDATPQRRWGGTAADTNDARTITWTRTLDFLDEHLASKEAAR